MKWTLTCLEALVPTKYAKAKKYSVTGIAFARDPKDITKKTSGEKFHNGQELYDQHDMTFHSHTHCLDYPFGV